MLTSSINFISHSSISIATCSISNEVVSVNTYFLVQALSESPQRVVTKLPMKSWLLWLSESLWIMALWKFLPLSVWVSYFILQQMQQRTKCSKGKTCSKPLCWGSTYVSPKPFWDYIVEVQIPGEMAQNHLDVKRWQADNGLETDDFREVPNEVHNFLVVSGCECLFRKFSSGILRGEFIKVFCVGQMWERYLSTSLNYRWWFLNLFGGEFLSPRKRSKMNPFGRIWFKYIIDDSKSSWSVFHD